MRSFSDVISIWPTSADMARDIGVRDVTIRAWRSRGIPARWWPEVAKAAKKRGVPLTLDKLATMATPPAGRSARHG